MVVYETTSLVVAFWRLRPAIDEALQASGFLAGRWLSLLSDTEVLLQIDVEAVRLTAWWEQDRCPEGKAQGVLA